MSNEQVGATIVEALWEIQRKLAALTVILVEIHDEQKKGKK